MTLPQQLLSLLVVGWLPGAALFRLPVLDRERRANLEPEERAFWTVVLSCAWSLLVVLLLAWANSYTFWRLLMVNAVLVLVSVGAARSQVRLRPARHLSLTALLPLALAVFCAMRFTPGAEYVMGGKDPGTYVNEGIQIAQRGSIRSTEPVIASVPAPYRDLFFPRYHDLKGQFRTDYYSLRFMGFRLIDPEEGVTVGQFPHLFPASIAVGYGLHGLTGARLVTPFWAILGVLAVYFVGVRLFGRLAAGAAAALLAIHVITVWFARYPNAELPMQAFLFSALLANARAHVDGDPFFAPVASVLLGLLLFLRFDAVLAVAGIAGGVLLGIFAGQRPRLSAIVTFAALAILALLYYRGPLRAYANQPMEFFAALPLWQWTALGVAAAVAIAALWIGASRPESRPTVVRYAPVAAGLLLCALGIYALYLREPGGRLAAHDAHALRTYANFYVTVPAVLAALLGYLLYARRAFWRDPAFFVTVAVFAVFIFFKLRIVPEHFWTARRFIPIVLPATMLFACAAGLGSVGGRSGVRLVRPILGMILVALLAWQYVRASAPLTDHVEYAGMIPHLERLASQFTERDLVIAEGRDAQSDVHVIATPLAYIYARNVLVLNAARPDKARFAEFLTWAQTEYERVFFIGGGGTDLLSDRYSVQALSSSRFQVPEYESPRNAYPRGVRGKEFEFTVYGFGPSESGADTGMFDLDIGVNDDLHVLRFYAKEQTDGRTFRWSRATSYVSVTEISPSSRELTVILGDGGRPPAAPPATVNVFLDDHQVGAWTVSGPFKAYSVPIPPDLAARAASTNDPVELRFLTATWTPARVLGTGDDRALGVMVDRVTIK